MKEKVKHITKVLSQTHGIDVSIYDETFLLNSIKKRYSENQFEKEKEYVALLQNDKMETAILINSLQNNYSIFFRNSLTFSVLEKIIFPSIIQNIKTNKKKEIRIWSAACAGGHEAYSISILLNELNNDDKEKFNYRIFATDKIDKNIAISQSGKYEMCDLKNVSLNRLENWFTKKSDSYFVKPTLKKNIEFSEFDLLDKESQSPSASIFGDFDVIICANLLFYYKEEYRKIILHKLKKSLSNNGIIITGEAEREILIQHHFKEVFPQSAIFRV